MVLTETGLAKVLQRIKSFVASQLNSKASAIHTHTSSDITDLPSGLTVDSALSSSSENAVQNKVVKNALDGKLGMNTGGGIVNRSGNGQYLYCQIATITILGSYVNSPIVLEISGRGILFSTVQIVFESGETTDPNLSKFISDSYEYFYIKKIDTSTWAVYVKYTQTWGNVTVHRVSGKGLALPSISCDFTASDLSELPSECIQVSNSFATVATSGSYNDLSDKPTIPSYSNFVKSGSGAAAGLVPAPSTTAGTTKYLREDGTWQVPPDHTYTVNNATLTIQKNGSNVATFTSNASSNVTANISVPTNNNQLTNGAGYITSSGSCASAGQVSTSVGADSTKNLIYCTMADNDYCRIMCGGSSNAGYMEIATADDGNEPIYVRQYTGAFGSVTRTLTLLDGSGNTVLPGRISLQGSYQIYVG